jgi:hypothetical protein
MELNVARSGAAPARPGGIKNTLEEAHNVCYPPVS